MFISVHYTRAKQCFLGNYGRGSERIDRQYALIHLESKVIINSRVEGIILSDEAAFTTFL